MRGSSVLLLVAAAITGCAVSKPMPEILRPNAYVDRVDGGEVVVKHYYSGRERGVHEIHLVGDAYMPRRLTDAIREGHRVGRAV